MHGGGDFIAENDPVRVLDAIVENLDISAIDATYVGGGTNSYHPRMLLKVVLYAYLQNVYSGYGNEENYEYLDLNFIEGYVKYNMFHKEFKRKYIANPFLPEHLFYNAEKNGVSAKVCAQNRRPASPVALMPRIAPCIKVGVRSQVAIGVRKERSSAHTLARESALSKKEGDPVFLIIWSPLFLCLACAWFVSSVSALL